MTLNEGSVTYATSRQTDYSDARSLTICQTICVGTPQDGIETKKYQVLKSDIPDRFRVAARRQAREFDEPTSVCDSDERAKPTQQRRER